ncbi:MAG TPA: molybdopterin-dependent oxidoreductase, partial [Pyrinomonadaceae bacterium]|nr:molybdopterin-dependent oxidoreductase [Pyrinomonadaceae bacterium]
GGAKLIVVNDVPIRLTKQAKQFIHINVDSYDAFAAAFADQANAGRAAEKLGVEVSSLDDLNTAITETEGDLIVIVGSELSANAQAAIAASAGRFSAENRRVLLHPLPPYNNSVGATDMLPGAKPVEAALKGAKAVLIGGSLHDASVLEGKDFVVVQELFETETTAFADVVFPAASFAEVDGTFTNNAGNVQRVRKAIDPIHQAKADWMITSLIAREMGVDFGYNLSTPAVFKAIAEAIPAYEGLRYPMLKDESEPVQAKYSIAARDSSGLVNSLNESVNSMNGGERFNETPKVGHLLHRLTTLTSKTAQFHLLAHGNPKPDNLLVAPLVQFALDGTTRESGRAEAASVSAADRSVPDK